MVIAPTLVLTSSNCIVLPFDIAPIDVVTPPEVAAFSGTRDLSDGLVDYAHACEPDAGWGPKEDGSFASRLGAPVPVTALTISQREGTTETVVGVREALTSRADSRCRDSLAILILDVPIDSKPMPMRLDSTTSPGEPVVLSGFGGIGEYRVHELNSFVEASTPENVAGSSPPRSLLLRGGVCDFESGGAVASQETGALLAVITSGTGEGCGEEQGHTIAVSVAPFRPMLLQAASLAVESLRAEPTRAGPLWPACAVE